MDPYVCFYRGLIPTTGAVGLILFCRPPLQAIMGLIRAPHRYGSTAGDYDLKIIRKHRNGWLTKIVRLLMWDSTRYYEEYMRAYKYDKRPVDADGNTIKNPTFGLEGDERTGVPDDIATTAFALTRKNKGYCECVPGCI